jgi:small subunit ribosomal protein S13
MIFNFKDKSLNYKINIRSGFSKVYGIGTARASFMADALGLGLKFYVKNLNFYIFEVISYLFKLYLIIDDRLKFLIKQQTIKFFEIKSIRGVRFNKGLPVRGQRTHSNAKQVKYYKKGQI